jgi:cation diffusion facilitator family transporter
MHSNTAAQHSHKHAYLGDNHDVHERRTRWVVALTAAMMVVEIVAGLAFGSMALLADGIHMATHAGALGVAAMAYAFARNHLHNPRFTFGTGKVGDLAGFASALVLAIIALGIAVASVNRLFHPGLVAYTEALWIAVIGLAVNLASAWLLGGSEHHHGHGDHDHHHDHAHHDNNMRAAYFNVLADALTSVLAIAALLVGSYLGWVWADAAMGIVGAIVIARWSWGLLRDAGGVLLDGTLTVDKETEVRDAIEADGDATVTDLHIWRVGPGRYAVIVSLVAANPMSPEEYKRRIATHSEYVHVTIEAHRCVGHSVPSLKAA